MCLLDAVERWDQRSIECTTRTHLDRENPLRGPGGLMAVHLVEYGAQAVAVHGGLLATAGSIGKNGLLTSLKNVQLAVSNLDQVQETLLVSAQVQLSSAAGWLYDFSIRTGELVLASGRLSVMPAASIPAETGQQGRT